MADIAFEGQNAKLTSLEGQQTNDLPSNKSIVGFLRKIAIVFTASITLGSCSVFKNVVDLHEKACLSEGRIIVHDPALWATYVEQARKTFENRKKRFGNKTEMAVIERVATFQERYGSSLSPERSRRHNELIRDDIFIVKDDKIVAQFVDFTARLDSLSGMTILTCTGLFPNLYALESADYE